MLILSPYFPICWKKCLTLSQEVFPWSFSRNKTTSLRSHPDHYGRARTSYAINWRPTLVAIVVPIPSQSRSTRCSVDRVTRTPIVRGTLDKFTYHQIVLDRFNHHSGDSDRGQDRVQPLFSPRGSR